MRVLQKKIFTLKNWKNVPKIFMSGNGNIKFFNVEKLTKLKILKKLKKLKNEILLKNFI